MPPGLSKEVIEPGDFLFRLGTLEYFPFFGVALSAHRRLLLLEGLWVPGFGTGDRELYLLLILLLAMLSAVVVVAWPA
jgi:hypothetical protein